MLHRFCLASALYLKSCHDGSGSRRGGRENTQSTVVVASSGRLSFNQKSNESKSESDIRPQCPSQTRANPPHPHPKLQLRDIYSDAPKGKLSPSSSVIRPTMRQTFTLMHPPEAAAALLRIIDLERRRRLVVRRGSLPAMNEPFPSRRRQCYKSIKTTLNFITTPWEAPGAHPKAQRIRNSRNTPCLHPHPTPSTQIEAHMPTSFWPGLACPQARAERIGRPRGHPTILKQIRVDASSFGLEGVQVGQGMVMVWRCT
ncbi:uncharacterized protein BDR25DRAFT_393665 [Lindgomyces ingoldianus]|uniref:Uncharacterized protein n=1 Tax=Lindgomyces ingoldianus TaxID=673940 RepID=A0ACB6QVR4_9PLEO|nr:uncharacterized protein BDR25DRAFT_393665 [Lindgomyces ingoldianus]KAF2471108.1 hypothetical protein BDR25DRAFT_393665 [Lindgomyces ingoldianus]